MVSLDHLSIWSSCLETILDGTDFQYTEIYKVLFLTRNAKFIDIVDVYVVMYVFL